MKRIIHAVRIHAPVSRVYENLTKQEGLAGWWSRKVKVDGGQGSSVHFTFHGDFHPEMRQTKLEKDRAVHWTCVAGHDNWRDNTFRFELEDADGETSLMFYQDYATELSDQVYGTYNFNWGYYLNSLKKLSETGKGTPFEPPKS